MSSQITINDFLDQLKKTLHTEQSELEIQVQSFTEWQEQCARIDAIYQQIVQLDSNVSEAKVLFHQFKKALSFKYYIDEFQSLVSRSVRLKNNLVSQVGLLESQLIQDSKQFSVEMLSHAEQQYLQHMVQRLKLRGKIEVLADDFERGKELSVWVDGFNSELLLKQLYFYQRQTNMPLSDEERRGFRKRLKQEKFWLSSDLFSMLEKAAIHLKEKLERLFQEINMDLEQLAVGEAQTGAFANYKKMMMPSRENLKLLLGRISANKNKLNELVRSSEWVAEAITLQTDLNNWAQTEQDRDQLELEYDVLEASDISKLFLEQGKDEPAVLFNDWGGIFYSKLFQPLSELSEIVRGYTSFEMDDLKKMITSLDSQEELSIVEKHFDALPQLYAQAKYWCARLFDVLEPVAFTKYFNCREKNPIGPNNLILLDTLHHIFRVGAEPSNYFELKIMQVRDLVNDVNRLNELKQFMQARKKELTQDSFEQDNSIQQEESFDTAIQQKSFFNRIKQIFALSEDDEYAK